MGKIILENVRIYAFHGCLIEEAKIGSDYLIDLMVHCNLQPSAKTDELTDTVDYVDLNNILKEEMAIRSKLLEHVVERILVRIGNELPLVSFAEVKLSKVNPPIGGDVQKVTVIMERNF